MSSDRAGSISIVSTSSSIVRAGVAAALLAVTFAVFAPVRHHDFVRYDDYVYVVDNPLLDQPLTLERLAAAFRPYETNWIPLTWISLQIDRALLGPAPPGFLFVNVLLHGATAVVLFFALATLTGAFWRSVIVAGVFAVHPLHVESVAWVSERKDVLSGLFFALTLLAWGHATADESRRRTRALVVALFGAGLLAKPMLVTTPFVLLLLDYWPLGRLQSRGVKRMVVEKWPLFALVVAVCVVTYVVQRDLGAMPFNAPAFLIRVQNAVHATSLYVVKSFWPTGLAVFYPYPPSIAAPLVTAVEVLSLAAFTAMAAHQLRARPYIAVGWLWFVGMLVPVLGLVQVGMQARADRYLYLPQIGLAVVVVWGLADLLSRLRPAARMSVAAAVAGASLTAFAVVAHLQVQRWSDTTTLFEHALAVTEGNYLAHKILGGEHWRAGRLEDAERSYLASLDLKNDWATTHNDIARLYRERDMRAQALRHFALAIRFDSTSVSALNELGATLAAFGRFAEAKPIYEEAVRMDPERADSVASLAATSLALGLPALALRHGREALHLDPKSSVAANTVAWILATSPDPATRDPERAVAIALDAAANAGPDRRRLLGTLAASLASVGRFEEAAATADEAVTLFEAAGEFEMASRARAHYEAYRKRQAIVDPATDPRGGSVVE